LRVWAYPPGDIEQLRVVINETATMDRLVMGYTISEEVQMLETVFDLAPVPNCIRMVRERSVEVSNP
jgi:hypothetical protein